MSNLNEEGLLYRDECYKIIGACMDVHSELGSGFLEAVYQEALAIEFRSRKIPFEAEKPLRIEYKEQYLLKTYCADFVCYGNIIVELKAAKMLASEHMAQVLNYLKATDSQLALLINFGSGSLQHRRVIRS